MIHKSKALVLHQVKYSETSLIVTLYTEFSGRQTYLINGIRSSKSKSKAALFQPLFLLDIEAYHHPGRDIHRLKEFKLSEVYQSLPFDILKSSVAIFLAEMLHRVLRSEEADPLLFEFLAHSLLFFDTAENGAANFHLWFLIQLSGYLGFKPVNNYSEINCWFHLKLGRFVPQRPVLPITPDLQQSEQLAQLMNLNPSELNRFVAGGTQRTALLTILVEYYAIHFEGIGKIHSLDVLAEVFQTDRPTA